MKEKLFNIQVSKKGALNTDYSSSNVLGDKKTKSSVLGWLRLRTQT